HNRRGCEVGNGILHGQGERLAAGSIRRSGSCKGGGLGNGEPGRQRTCRHALRRSNFYLNGA
ncbi:hypothetical protein NE602_26540, partial [Bacteroides cellulosilyticus]|uniref:hypothetical protein n=1 Tax=Bacteroides cellulosilyticus TaxID=246787 RepID=UPI00210C54A0